MVFVFFFNDTPTPEIYTLSLHGPLPICADDAAAVDRADAEAKREREAQARLAMQEEMANWERQAAAALSALHEPVERDRKSTRLKSSHANISQAVFCLKKKNTVFSLQND